MYLSSDGKFLIFRSQTKSNPVTAAESSIYCIQQCDQAERKVYFLFCHDSISIKKTNIFFFKAKCNFKVILSLQCGSRQGNLYLYYHTEYLSTLFENI